MPDKNEDNRIPQTPATTDPTGRLITTVNFQSPENPILWGPKQEWAGVDGYTEPSKWRNGELLSIPRVVRMMYSNAVDACDYTGGIPPEDVILEASGLTGVGGSDGVTEFSPSQPFGVTPASASNFGHITWTLFQDARVRVSSTDPLSAWFEYATLQTGTVTGFTATGLVDTFNADGPIVSSPSGSGTHYSIEVRFRLHFE